MLGKRAIAVEIERISDPIAFSIPCFIQTASVIVAEGGINTPWVR